jgi:hypothetical protein
VDETYVRVEVTSPGRWIPFVATIAFLLSAKRYAAKAFGGSANELLWNIVCLIQYPGAGIATSRES